MTISPLYAALSGSAISLARYSASRTNYLIRRKRRLEGTVGNSRSISRRYLVTLRHASRLVTRLPPFSAIFSVRDF